MPLSNALVRSFVVLVAGSLVSGAVLAQAPAPAAPQAPQLALAPCAGRPASDTARCGTLEVFENRETKKGRTIRLNVLVLPARNKVHVFDPVFWLDGGPGAAATRAVGAARGGVLTALNADHDVVFVDQRGTGKSNGLDCDIGDDPRDAASYYGPILPVALVKACRAKLEPLADLRLYTTPIAMDDLDDVRNALGYAEVDIVAASYGTIAAQVYIRQHGDRVRAAFLSGVATPSIKQPLLFARAAQVALDSLFVECAADADCAKAFPKLRADFAAALARFDHGPVDIAVPDSGASAPRHVALPRETYVERLRLLLYGTTTARLVPKIVHAAAGGDFEPFVRETRSRNVGGSLSRGMYLTVTCSEGVPFITAKELADASRGTFVGERRVRAHQAACAEWPRGEVPKGYTDAVASNVPVFMLSGAVDGSTPPSYGAGAVKKLSAGRQVVVRYLGHQMDSPCVVEMLGRFIATASASSVDVSCTKTIRRPPFVTQ